MNLILNHTVNLKRSQNQKKNRYQRKKRYQKIQEVQSKSLLQRRKMSRILMLLIHTILKVGGGHQANASADSKLSTAMLRPTVIRKRRNFHHSPSITSIHITLTIHTQNIHTNHLLNHTSNLTLWPLTRIHLVHLTQNMHTNLTHITQSHKLTTITNPHPSITKASRKK